MFGILVYVIYTFYNHLNTVFYLVLLGNFIMNVSNYIADKYPEQVVKYSYNVVYFFSKAQIVFTKIFNKYI